MPIRKAMLFLLLLGALRAGAQSFSPVRCLSSGGQCDAANRCVAYDVDALGFLRERTLGTCTTIGPIIIGGGFDPPNPPPQGPYVAFVNDTRSGDLVVAAKVDDLPGGTKEIGIEVHPQNKTATLRLERFEGAGSAFFDAARTQTTLANVKNGQRITIYGGATSDVARNMLITARIDGKNVPGAFAFTVFRVAPLPRNVGMPLSTVLPDSAMAASGNPVVISLNTVLRPQLLRTLYQDLATIRQGVATDQFPDGKRDERAVAGRADLDRLGHRHVDELIEYGGIVFKGIIVPKIDHADFSRFILPKQSGRESFDWKRRKTVREKQFDANGRFLRNTAPCFTDADDDGFDIDEDLIPEDGAIWVYDTPAFVVGDPKKPRGTNDGDVIRGHYTFMEWVEYAGVRVSPKLPWYWRFSNVDPVGPKNLAQDNSQGPDDNKVGVGTIPIPNC